MLAVHESVAHTHPESAFVIDLSRQVVSLYDVIEERAGRSIQIRPPGLSDREQI